jgi:heat shock protein HslJ
MSSRTFASLVAAALAASCAMSDPNLLPRSGAPPYMPASAIPPTLTSAANDLGIPTWQWQRTRAADGRIVSATAPDRYTLKFEGGGRVLVRADCNRGSGAYEIDGGTMKMGPVALTRMGCPAGSQDAEFTQALSRVKGYAINGGEMTLALADGGTMTLRAVP